MPEPYNPYNYPGSGRMPTPTPTPTPWGQPPPPQEEEDSWIDKLLMFLFGNRGEEPTSDAGVNIKRLQGQDTERAFRDLMGEPFPSPTPTPPPMSNPYYR